MHIVVVTDIHGIHDDLRTQLACLGNPTLISPWDGEGKPFATEQEAVSIFHQRSGLSSYEKKIAEVVGGKPTALIGFSVGASSLWRYISSAQCHPSSIAFLYYGSRIRDYLDLVPKCRAALIFAENEVSFDPASLVKIIHAAGADCSVIADTHHGFMNPPSPYYREDIAKSQFDLIKRRIHEHESHF